VAAGPAKEPDRREPRIAPIASEVRESCSLVVKL